MIAPEIAADLPDDRCRCEDRIGRLEAEIAALRAAVVGARSKWDPVPVFETEADFEDFQQTLRELRGREKASAGSADAP